MFWSLCEKFLERIWFIFSQRNCNNIKLHHKNGIIKKSIWQLQLVLNLGYLIITSLFPRREAIAVSTFEGPKYTSSRQQMSLISPPVRPLARSVKYIQTLPRDKHVGGRFNVYRYLPHLITTNTILPYAQSHIINNF